MAKKTPAPKNAATTPTFRAAIKKVNALREEEAVFLSAAKRNEIEAMVRAYWIGRTIDVEVDKGYGKAGVRKFAAEIGVSTQTAYDYVYLARGALIEELIREHPSVTRKYYQALGRRINAFEDYLGALITVELITKPLWKEGDRDEKEPDVELVTEVERLLNDTRRRIRNELKVGYTLVPVEDDICDDRIRRIGLPTKPGNEVAEHKALEEAGLLWQRIGRVLDRSLSPLNLSGVSNKDLTEMARRESGSTAKGMLREAKRYRKIGQSLAEATPVIGKSIADRVLHGRSEVLLRDRALFTERMVDVVITDPPYSKEYYAEWRAATCIDHDAERTTGKQARLVGRIAELLVSRKIIKEQFMWFSFCPIDYVHVFLPPILKAFAKLGCKHQVLVWDKQRVAKVGGDCWFGRQAEAILYISVNRPLGTVGANGQTTPLHSSLLSYRAVDQDGDNFSWKPVDLLKRLISLSTYDIRSTEADRQVILDPFAGSGSTGVAAIECHRDFRLIESHPQQYETAKASVSEALKKHAPATPRHG